MSDITIAPFPRRAPPVKSFVAFPSTSKRAAPTADAEVQPAQPDPGELRLAEAPTPLTNEPTAPNSDVRIAQLTEKLAKLMTTLGEKTEAAAAAKIAAEKANQGRGGDGRRGDSGPRTSSHNSSAS